MIFGKLMQVVGLLLGAGFKQVPNCVYGISEFWPDVKETFTKKLNRNPFNQK